jgi:hypothetical protein
MFWHGLVDGRGAVLAVCIVLFCGLAAGAEGGPSAGRGEKASRAAAEVCRSTGKDEGSTASSAACGKLEKAPAFELKDQFRHKHAFAYPAEKVTVLGIADRHSYEPAEHWYDKLKTRYGDGVEIQGMAALRDFPLLWRPWLGVYLRHNVEEPILMDWHDVSARLLDYRRGQLNVYVIGRDGQVVLRLFGKPTAEALAQLDAALQPLLEAGSGAKDDETKKAKTPAQGKCEVEVESPSP